MDKIRLAFKKIKQDILSLNSEINKIKSELQEIKQILVKKQQNSTKNPLKNPQTYLQEIPTNKEIPAHNFKEEAPEPLNFGISTRNEGVPTDRQTNRQTDKQTKNNQNLIFPQNFSQNFISNIQRFSLQDPQDLNKISNSNTENQTTQNLNNKPIFNPILQQNIERSVVPNQINHTNSISPINSNYDLENNRTKLESRNEFDEAIKILNSLDKVKKEIRKKFKRLTKQEFKVFETLYLFEEKGLLTDYKLIANSLNLTESSIRDYISRLIKKGIPIIKEKINNKQVILHIDKELKRVTPLETIIKLREI